MDTEPIFLCVFYDDDDDDDDELFGTSTQRKRGNMLGLSARHSHSILVQFCDTFARVLYRIEIDCVLLPREPVIDFM